MDIINKISKKIREGGFMYTLKTIENRLSQDVFISVCKLIFCRTKTENIIAIESHNDFDCNGGAFYDYLINNHLNDKWKIIWLLRNPIDRELPKNVLAFDFRMNNFKKEYYLNKAKILMCDDKFIKKRRKSQIEVYCQHGLSLKNVKGHINTPEYIDFILSSSKNYDPYLCNNISVPYPNDKMIHFGYPYNDALFLESNNELNKVTSREYSRVILWMPTFRKKNEHRDDSDKPLPLGIPMFTKFSELVELNNYLNKLDTLLIIKIHPMQYKESYKDLRDLGNVIILDGQRIKRLDIDNYRLMKYCDGLISDYSSAAYSFLLLNRQIGFVLSDLKEYKLGFSVENYRDYLPGQEIYSIDDLKLFVENVYNQKDSYEKERKALIDFLYENQDGNASVRLAKFLKIE